MRFKWEYPALLGLLMTFSVIVVSCSRDSTSPAPTVTVSEEPRASQEKLVDLQNQYGWTGAYHTDALAHVYSKLSRGKAFSSKSDKCRAGVAALKEFNKSFSKDGKSKGVADDFIPDDVCSGNGSANQAPSPFGNSSGLSPKATALLQQITSLFESGATASTVVSNVNAIEGEASGTLSPAEAGAVVSLGSVAISSAQYWDANLPSWRSASSIGGPAANVLTAGTSPTTSLSGPAPGAPRASESSGDVSIGQADVFAFFSSLLAGWWMGALDIEVSAIRAVIASMMAAL